MSPDCYTSNTTEFCCRPTREQTVVEHRPGRLHQFSIAVWKEDPRAAFEGNLSVRVDFCKLLLHTISINSGRVLEAVDTSVSIRSELPGLVNLSP